MREQHPRKGSFGEGACVGLAGCLWLAALALSACATTPANSKVTASSNRTLLGLIDSGRNCPRTGPEPTNVGGFHYLDIDNLYVATNGGSCTTDYGHPFHTQCIVIGPARVTIGKGAETRVLYYVPPEWIGDFVETENVTESCRMTNAKSSIAGQIAHRMLQKEARKGDELRLQAAKMALRRQDYLDAAVYFGIVGEHGDAESAFIAGVLFDRGLGVTKNPAKATSLLLLASKQDYYPAQARLALMYEQGDGVPRDVRKGAYWRKRAARNPHKSGGPDDALLPPEGDVSPVP